mmetsp:Transcript_74098/g.176507  ORF Transcript_74098/g.176507 Transcript_74098/m.176507 type:complete len:108 (+) Transcript_74098:66-389(+)
MSSTASQTLEKEHVKDSSDLSALSSDPRWSSISRKAPPGFQAALEQSIVRQQRRAADKASATGTAGEGADEEAFPTELQPHSFDKVEVMYCNAGDGPWFAYAQLARR